MISEVSDGGLWCITLCLLLFLTRPKEKEGLPIKSPNFPFVYIRLT